MRSGGLRHRLISSSLWDSGVRGLAPTAASRLCLRRFGRSDNPARFNHSTSMLSLLSALLPFTTTFAQLDSEVQTTGQVSPIVWVIDVAFIVLMIAAFWKIFSKA